VAPLILPIKHCGVRHFPVSCPITTSTWILLIHLSPYAATILSQEKIPDITQALQDKKSLQKTFISTFANIS
jgi:hypothetical protein